MASIRMLRKTAELAWGPGTVALSVDPAHTLAADGPPAKRETWIQISKVGEWKGHSRGPFQLTRAHFESAIAEQSRMRTPLNFDYEHASASCIPVHAPSSGYASKLEIRGEPGAETLWAYTRLTKKAVQEVLDEEYRYISPTWMFDVPDRVEGEEKLLPAVLHSVALTNTPFLDGMEPITLSATMSRLASIGRFASVALAGKESMDPKNEAPAAESPEEEKDGASEDSSIVERMMQVLGLADRAALGAWMDEQEKGAKPEQKDVKATETALSLALAANERMAAELAGLRAVEADREVTALIATGRALETERAELLALREASPSMFKKLSERAQVVPIGTESRAPKGPATAATAVPETDTEKRVAANLRAAGFDDAEISSALKRERERKEIVR